MFKKFIMVSTLVLSAFTASAFTTDECVEAAENVYQATQMLNTDPVKFKAIHAEIKATPAVEFGWSEQLKAFVVGIVDMLKPGMDAKKAGEATYAVCPKVDV